MRKLRSVSCFSQKGVAVIETALTLPLILLFLFGIINYGIMLYNKAVITNASREAARFGVVYDSVAFDDAKKREVMSKVDNYCADRLVTFGAGSALTTAVTKTGNELVVNVTYNFKPVVGSLFPAINGDNIVAKTVMKFEI